MKKVILGLALATMIISCKETKTEKVEEVQEVPAPEPMPAEPDTVVTKTETTVDTAAGTVTKKVEKTVK